MNALERVVQAVVDSQREAYVALLNAHIALALEHARVLAVLGADGRHPGAAPPVDEAATASGRGTRPSRAAKED